MLGWDAAKKHSPASTSMGRPQDERKAEATNLERAIGGWSELTAKSDASGFMSASICTRGHPLAIQTQADRLGSQFLDPALALCSIKIPIQTCCKAARARTYPRAKRPITTAAIDQITTKDRW